MSYSKLEVRFLDNGGEEKKRVITLPKKVIEYGDRYGYSSLYVTYDDDHLIIKGHSSLGEVLLDRNINGKSNSSNSYKDGIYTILLHKWID